MWRAEIIAGKLRDGLLPGVEDPFVCLPLEPADVKRLEESGSASIDLHLGCWFRTLRVARMSHLRVRNVKGQQLSKLHFVPLGKKFFLHPGTFTLGVTLEWLRLPQDVGAYIVGKSSWGRRGLIIATAAGVHPGFLGTLTLELSNAGEIPIEIRPGTPICQLFFHEARKTTERVEQSPFLCQTKPVLGSVEFPEDALATALEVWTDDPGEDSETCQRKP